MTKPALRRNDEATEKRMWSRARAASRRRIAARMGGAVLLIASVAIPGCTAGAAGSDLTVRPKPRAIGASSKSLHLPADEKFSLCLAPANKAPGLAGSADADSTASPDGNANSTGKVTGGGQASASFQVGHAVSNDSEQQSDFNVRLKFDYESSAATTPAGGPDGVVALNVFARDEKSRLVQTINVLAHSTEAGPLNTKGSKQADFVATLGPGGTLTVFVAGAVTLDVPDQHTASCTLALRGLEMEITSKPAAAAPTTQSSPK